MTSMKVALSQPLSSLADQNSVMAIRAQGREIIRVFVLPGGKMPERKSDGAVGFDVHARAIVSPFEQDPRNDQFRKTLFDFNEALHDKSAQSRELRRHIFFTPIIEKKYCEKREFVYRLYPGERVLIGAGIVIELNPHDSRWFVWVAPRSGLASKYGITIGNSPGTIDCDYRGEAGIVLVNQGENHFDISQNMRIAQLIFCRAEIPALLPVDTLSDLTTTKRAGGGFGSTGL